MQQQEASLDISLSLSPEKKEGVMAQQVLEEMVLYDGETEMGYSLNASARHIWDLCDGKRTIHSICIEIAGQIDVDAELLHQDVTAAVQELASHGLLRLSNETDDAAGPDTKNNREAQP